MLTNFLDHKLGKKYNTFDLLVLFLIIAMTLMLRLWFIDLQFPDYTICLKPWVEQFRSYGGFAGLKYNIGNYTPAYMHLLMLISYFDVEPLYVIKGVGICLDYVLAIVAAKLIAPEDSKYKQVLLFSAVLLLPTVIACSLAAGMLLGSFLLRSGADDAQLLAAIRETIWAKPREHHFNDSSMPATRGMYCLGG